MNKSFIACLTLFAVADQLPCSGQTGATTNGANKVVAVPVAQDHEAAERSFNARKTPLPPRRIIGNIYYVGPAGVSSWLITILRGHILIDTTFEECVPQICGNVEKLHSLPRDVFFGPHADQYGLADKLARLDRSEIPNPFIDPDGWQKFLAWAEGTYRKQLAVERAAETRGH